MSSFDHPQHAPENSSLENEGQETAEAREASLDNHRIGVLVRQLAGDRLPKNPAESEGLITFVASELSYIKESYPRLYEAADGMARSEKNLIETHGEETVARVMGEVNHAAAQVIERHEREAEGFEGRLEISAAGIYGEALQEVALRPGSAGLSTEMFGSLFAHRLAKVQLAEAAPAYLADLRSRQ